MARLPRAGLLAGLAAAVLFLAVLTAPTSSAQRPDARLTVSPSVYVGGQAVTFEGNIGRAAARRIRLQVHMNRPGDGWEDREGFRGRTDAQGNFRFQHAAPAMFGIRYRVVSGRLATPAWSFDARSQDLVLEVDGGHPRLGEDQVVAGEPFAVAVDTTPTLSRRPDLPAPPIPGRTLTLQRRVDGDHWQTLATGITDQDGQGSFEVTVEQPGEVVYRVRQEDWTQGRHEIGWFPSFPTYVEVLAAPPAHAPEADEPREERTEPVSSTSAAVVNTASTTASQARGWAPSLWDFSWVFGESLTSPPSRGTDPKGWWLDTSDGTGRAAKHNGGLMLDSQRDNVDGPGDRGTTAVTLRGNPMRYGRWESRVRLKSTETTDRDYRMLVELVPDRPADHRCGAQNITVAEIAAHGSTVTIGAKALKRRREWTRTVSVGSVNNRALAFAVEVSKRHVSWFLEGEVIGTVRSRAAVSDVPMTLRMSLVGHGQEEMNRTQAISDWVRGFSLDRGRLTRRGPALTRGKHAGGC